MEDELRSCEAQRELRALRRKLELVEEEKREYGDDCTKAKRDVRDLQHTGKDTPGAGCRGAPAEAAGGDQPAPSCSPASTSTSATASTSSSLSYALQPTQMERRPSNSAIQELKGIMETFGRSPSPHPKAAPPPLSPTRDEQLQRILLRRRDALEPQRHDADDALKKKKKNKNPDLKDESGDAALNEDGGGST
ncbi:hypothetical protein EYF80_033239 [Liparis tanakae]|uniref:Shootin-1 n=1 Tax=Liparis tanakae TaxID=230148 RepID=A0A4Z2GUT2_9TELE|nr:hypothetical protein EYF80_033239 [Liparis tanakae]